MSEELEKMLDAPLEQTAIQNVVPVKKLVGVRGSRRFGEKIEIDW